MVDLTVRGAGIFGLSVAWECTRRGARVCVVDPGGPGAGASGGIVGALAPHVPENWNPKKAFQLDSLLAAPDFWSGVADASEQDPGYARTGRLQPLADAAAVAMARARAVSARAVWQENAVWEVIAADPDCDWHPPSPTGLLIHDSLSARLHPRRACAALSGALRRAGAGIVTEAPDRGAVLWATGAAGLAGILGAAGRPAGVPVKGQAALLRLDRARAPQLFADALHIVPHADGTVAIGSTSENSFADPTGTDAQLDAVLDRARRALPLLAGAPVIERWAGLRPRARSRAPMLGPWPDRPGHFIANGGFKIGFGMAPGIARVMADLILEGHDRIPPGFEVAASL